MNSVYLQVVRINPVNTRTIPACKKGQVQPDEVMTKRKENTPRVRSGSPGKDPYLGKYVIA